MRDKNQAVLRDLLADDSGQDLMEYALIASLVVLVAIVSVKTFGNTVANYWNNLTNNVTF